MKIIFRYMKKYTGWILLAVTLKLLSTVFELFIPYVLEHIIDTIVPQCREQEDIMTVIRWGLLMFGTALLAWAFNVSANRAAIRNAHNVSYDIRQALFVKTMNLTGRQFDKAGLPSLISRMTSDSYNVQTAVQQLQSLCVRAPLMLFGGLVMMLMLDVRLAMILVYILPFLFAVIFFVTARGIPMFKAVQEKLDDVVRIMRENITGIWVVKALSKTEYEKKRFEGANQSMMDSDVRASTAMALPWPLMSLLLNIGLTLVVLVGARRVDAGLMDPGVILAFLTYFNMITMGVMGMNRIFISLSRASASANRMGEVIDLPLDDNILPPEEGKKPHGDEFIRFEHVNFSYVSGGSTKKEDFAGGSRENALKDIDFALKKGESLGIIGPTGCGKTTIINLLMHFYDTEDGGVFVDGRDVRTYEKDELHAKFGTVFQNDMIFRDTLYNNVDFGRGIGEETIRQSIEDAQVSSYIDSLDKGLQYEADIRGANLSGGQKQRIMVARALAGRPEILVLDDSSSALDYKTDAAMRRAIAAHQQDATVIMIAQRVSSVMNMTNILVMDNGACIGYGTHEQLLRNCPAYKEIFDTQMGAMAE
ncbi:MAG: ABC transporter ATP-binding protein [Lachnospiraceae bacterium]|nr:ABC transporter ATP-binding protein [Butyrivibrio sp.]MBQ9909970.1 ABC transporter ATP-binding protein [Lachnospiraceae bacterium]